MTRVRGAGGAVASTNLSEAIVNISGFLGAYARAEDDGCTELNTRSHTGARVVDVRLGTAILRPLWYAAGTPNDR
jgi:hypothetical protein